MVLRMTRAVKRSGTANHQFTKRIPADVLRILDGLPAAYRPKGWGKSVISFTLGTADKRQAAAEHARASADVEARFAALRRGVIELSHREVTALSGTVYRMLTGALSDNPGQPAAWSWDHLQFNKAPNTAEDASPEDRQLADFRHFVSGLADRLLASEGLVVSDQSRAALVQAVALSFNDARQQLARNAAGDYRPDPVADRFPVWVSPATPNAAVARNKLTLPALFDRWADHPEQGPVSRRTKARYRGVFGAVAAFMNNPDARNVTTDDLSRYVEARIKDDSPGRLLPKVARDVHKAALSSVYGWAKAKRIVPSNPAEGVAIKVARIARARRPEASDTETAELVKAVLELPATAPAGTPDAAKRWAILITLYTGCRIGEATQLRKEDFTTTAGKLPMIRITPEAGDVKDKEARMVPVHGRLAELGLLAFVNAAPEGPLFYDPERRRSAKATTPLYELAAKDVAAWSREHGLGDPLQKRPMHSLRHRFILLARTAGMEGQYMRAITGHEAGDESERYGSFDPATLHREIARLRPEVVEGSRMEASADQD